MDGDAHIFGDEFVIFMVVRACQRFCFGDVTADFMYVRAVLGLYDADCAA